MGPHMNWLTTHQGAQPTVWTEYICTAVITSYHREEMWLGRQPHALYSEDLRFSPGISRWGREAVFGRPGKPPLACTDLDGPLGWFRIGSLDDNNTLWWGHIRTLGGILIVGSKEESNWVVKIKVKLVLESLTCWSHLKWSRVAVDLTTLCRIHELNFIYLFCHKVQW